MNRLLPWLALTLLVPALAEPIPYRTGPDSGELLLRSLGSLVVAVLVALTLALLIKRFAPGLLSGLRRRQTGRRQLETLERLRISPTTQVVVVRWHDEEWLIAEGSQGTQLLGKRPHHSTAGEDGQDG
ncbi:flagellar biosynthetic protein FliO [Chitinimonas lacunae]|uniref:Flagellar biosynthetic protein FliO n=1 Tax=Chitinimonas lacunae TaxID=1963018 RepID=A0ABV8MY03_9NEIS